MLKIDTRQLNRLVRDLALTRSKAIPYAIRNALNTQAFDARQRWQAEMQSRLTLRNRWTTGSVRVEKATGLNVMAMQSRTGSLADYVRKTELGDPKAPHGHEGVPLPTAAAAGQGKASRRTRPVRRGKGIGKLKAQTLTQRRHPHPGVRVKIGIWQARKSGKKIAYLELSKKKGIFQIMGGKRHPTLRQIWDLTRSGVYQKPHATLEPAVAWVRKRTERTYKRAFLAELKRWHVCGY
jgi:hypothetical protein